MRLCQRTVPYVLALGGLGAVYAVALGAVLANPARWPPHTVDLATQGTGVAASLALLLVLRRANAGCGAAGRTRVSWALAGALAASLLLVRLPLLAKANQASLGRWDALAATVSIYAFATQLYFALAPHKKRWSVAYLGLLLTGVPLLTALPNIFRELRNSKRVDRAMLAEAARAAGLAYRVSTIVDAKTDTQVLVDVRRDGGGARVAFVAFAGTTSARDVLTNAAIADARLPLAMAGGTADGARARVHAGFLRAYLGVRDAVLDAVRRAGDAGATTVVVCGHSLGGALATLAALDLPHAHCLTFGSPQVGNAAFVALFDARTAPSVRVVNPFDLVPRSMGAQLEHVKGYYFVASVAPAVAVTFAHSIGAYQAGVRRGAAANWLLLTLAQPAYAVGALLAVLALYWAFARAASYISSP